MSLNNKFLLYLVIFSLFLTSCVNLNLFSDEEDIIQYSQNLEHVLVTSIVDGDTIYINGTSKVRIVGIDTPEIHSGSKPVGEYGEEAKKFLEEFVTKYEIYIKRMGYDNYGRILAYVFGKVDENTYAFYESSVLKAGLARPLIYFDNDDPFLTPKIVWAYNYAFQNKNGIFSKWYTAPILRDSTNYTLYIGKIVFLEGVVNNVVNSNGYWTIYGNWFKINIREEEYNYFFNNYNLYNLVGEKVRFYGGLWDDNGIPEILLRSPNEIVIL